MSEQTLYKVVPRPIWTEAEHAGEFTGSGIDLTDGFIHLSTASQVIETVQKHFAGQQNLLLISIDAGKIAEDLKWEPSRGGALFPHVYGTIPIDAVRATHPLPINSNGEHQFPPLQD
jgi:uncharacterized protein (DUF952 family)